MSSRASRLVDTPAGFQEASARLREGSGPFAIDTERASGYRYNDRAFLVQVNRRGIDTMLFAPEHIREEFTAALAPVLCGAEWILHSARTDLSCLGWLGLYPGTLIDTELAGRFAGFDHVNLAAMCRRLLGVDLAKGHGAEDWSRTPLPEEWLDYAAADVDYLPDLADAVISCLPDHAYRWWDAECRAIVTEFRGVSAPEVRRWYDIRGISSLTGGTQIQAAYNLWKARERIAVPTDTSPARLLSDKALVAAARELPRTKRDFGALSSVRHHHFRHIDTWLAAIDDAIAAQSTPAAADLRAHLEGSRRPSSHPPHTMWPRQHPESAAALEEITGRIAGLSAASGVDREQLIPPRVLRQVIWEATGHGRIRGPQGLAARLLELGAREWQVSLTMPEIAPILTAR